MPFYILEITLMKVYRFIPIIFVLLVNLVWADEREQFTHQHDNLSYNIKVGDWIFRKGVQVDSLIAHQFSGGKFSHIGMVVSINPDIKIIHATTSDDENYINQVIISSFDEFITPELAEKYAIARPNFLSEIQNQQIVNELLTKQGQAFVLASREEPHLYCTTLLYDAIIKYQPDFTVQWQHTQFPFFTGDYLFPSAFANHPDITWIYHYPTLN